MIGQHEHKDWIKLNENLSELLKEYDLVEILEELVDKEKIENITQALSQVCLDKAKHIDRYWGDKEGAKQWERVAIKLDKLI